MRTSEIRKLDRTVIDYDKFLEIVKGRNIEDYDLVGQSVINPEMLWFYVYTYTDEMFIFKVTNH